MFFAVQRIFVFTYSVSVYIQDCLFTYASLNLEEKKEKEEETRPLGILYALLFSRMFVQLVFVLCSLPEKKNPKTFL